MFLKYGRRSRMCLTTARLTVCTATALSPVKLCFSPAVVNSRLLAGWGLTQKTAESWSYELRKVQQWLQNKYKESLQSLHILSVTHNIFLEKIGAGYFKPHTSTDKKKVFKWEHNKGYRKKKSHDFWS